MSLAEFERHLSDPAPGFRYTVSGDQDEKPAFLARVSNRINPPADSNVLLAIERFFGPAAITIKQFYAEHDGVFMYVDTLWTRWSGGKYKSAGIEFFPAGEWQEKSNEMRETFSAMGWSDEDMPDWLRLGIAFGEITHSANYFVIQPTGEHPQKIFYADHDSFESDPIASSFDAFLDQILADPAAFLLRFGCYTRYSDGETETQWIPKHYVVDADRQSSLLSRAVCITARAVSPSTSQLRDRTRNG